MRPAPKRLRTEPGFTLVEVLVALAVIAIGLVAVLAVAARSGRVDSELQQQTFAAWVASNQIERMRLQPKWPSVGDSDGTVTLAGQKWHWKATVANTQDPDLRRVTMSVATDDAQDEPVTQMLGFLGRKTGGTPPGLPSPGGDQNQPHPPKNGGGR